MTLSPIARLAAAAVMALACAGMALAQASEAQLRKTLAERIPSLPKIDEVSKTPIPGLYEIRIGTDIYYADEKGDHIVQGSIIDTRTRTNLTDARIDKLTAVDFASAGQVALDPVQSSAGSQAPAEPRHWLLELLN